MKPILLLLLTSSVFAQAPRPLEPVEITMSEQVGWAYQFRASPGTAKRAEQDKLIAEWEAMMEKRTVQYARDLAAAVKKELGTDIVLVENDSKKLGVQIESMKAALSQARQKALLAQSAAIKREQDAESTRLFYEQEAAKRGNALRNELERLEYENRKLKGK